MLKFSPTPNQDHSFREKKEKGKTSNSANVEATGIFNPKG